MKFYWIIIIAILLILIIIVSLSSCSSSKKIYSLKPEPSNDAPLVYTSNTSYFNMPVSISLIDIEKQMNTILSDLIYEDTILDDDNIEMSIWKTDYIKLESVSGKISTQIPLKIKLKVRYGTSWLGLNDTKTINLKGKLSLLSKINLIDYTLHTNSEIIDFSWDESPNIEIAGKKIPITYIVNPAISIFKKKITKIIDESIPESNDYKPSLLDFLDTLSQPFMMEEEYESWLKINPLEVWSSQISVSDHYVNIDMGLKCTIMTMIGQEPAKSFNRNNIVFSSIPKSENDFEVSLAAVSTYENASNLIYNNIHNYTFKYKNKRFKVDKVDLWYKDGNVIIAMKVLGSVTGTIYLSGNPKYDSETKEIYFDNLQYVLDSKNVLLKSASWMLGDFIISKIKTLSRYSIAQNMDEAKLALQEFITNYSPMTGVSVNGKISNMEFEKMEINDKAMIAFIKISGYANTKIEGLEP
ncbi:MAG: DUF4403 family protein [Saprospiraceae bacterium]